MQSTNRDFIVCIFTLSGETKMNIGKPTNCSLQMDSIGTSVNVMED